MKIYRLGLKEMQKQLLKLLENTHDGFFALDRRWRYLYINPTAEKYARVPRQKLLGKVIWEEFPNAKKTLFYKKYHEAMASGKNLEFEELIDHQWFDIHVVPFGQGIWVFYRDITTHKLADQRKDEFIRMTSHELKTPITSLKLYAELLREQTADPKTIEYVRNINHQADQLNKIITDMLDLSRIESGKLEFRKKRFDLVPVLQAVVVDLQKTVPHRLELDCQIEPAMINGDKMKLTQALANLINNAAKYSPGRERVIIKARTNRRQVEISVQDFGVGIDPSQQSLIFDRFFQIGSSQGKIFPGLGIGLYLTKTIAEKHHGKIGLKSVVNQGSTFTLSLPLADETKK